MTHLRVAAHAAVHKDGKYLLIRRSSTDDYMPGKWDFPGGTMEIGETVEDGLLREVLEETGLAVTVVEPLFVFTNLADVPQQETIVIVFLCEYAAGELVLSEHDAAEWVVATEFTKFDGIHFIQEMARRPEVLAKLASG